MTFEMFGSGCFGAVIGFVAWHVVRAGEASFDVKQLAALIGALLGAVVLAAFPAGTTLFAAYASGLALGFFLVPASRVLASILSSISQSMTPPKPYDVPSEVANHLQYIDEHWVGIERLVLNALKQRQGRIRQYHLRALPLDEAGRVSVLRKYARVHSECTAFGQGFLGWTLRQVEPRPASSDLDEPR